jgi:hypothetical protein
MLPSLNDVAHRVLVQWPRRFCSGDVVIREAITRGSPCMIARFGSGEIQATVFPRLPWLLRRALRRRCIDQLHFSAGFFPRSETALLRFAELMASDAEAVDILGSWRVEESMLARSLTRATFVPLVSLEPYYSSAPWTEALAGRKVLVVHPFKQTIERQYHTNRSRIFRDPRMLPEFASFTVIQAVQSIAASETPFADWFEALESMKREIDRVDFDVALIGCGAYGFPLAAHVKRQGRVAIHLGGATQLLFGIRGRRWDDHPVIAPLINDSWVRPSADETPGNAHIVEKACYW